MNKRRISKSLGALIAVALTTNVALAEEGSLGNPGIAPSQSSPNDLSDALDINYNLTVNK